MGAEQIGLLEELSGGRLYSSAILSTYEFDGAFFENDILPVLKQLDVTNIVVLTDTDSYRSTSDVTKAGQEYYIDHVECPKIHHPKFTALFGCDCGRVLVGSANLTKPGWQQSGELMTVFDHPAETEEVNTTPLFAQLREFIEYSQAQISSSHAIDAINGAFTDAPWLPEATNAEPEGQINLLHNYAEPLLSQVRKHIGEDPIDEMEICSPFFSGGNTEPFEELCEFNPEQITVNIQPNKVEGFKSNVFDSPQLTGTDIMVNKMALTGDDVDRYLHAKLLLFTGPAGSWAFYGSPNFTKSALLQTGDVGNIELGVLRYEPDPEYFAYLLDDETVTREPISPDSVDYHPPTSDGPDKEAPDFQLTDAYIEADEATDETLIITYEASPPQQAKVTLSRGSDDEELVMEDLDPDDGHLEIQDNQVSQFCEQAVQAQVTLEYSSETMTSDARWVALPSLKQTPRPSEIQAIEISEGRDGLLNVLDRLPTWGLICNFLENVDFGTPSVTGDRVTIGGGDPGGNDTGGMEDWEPPNRDELLEQKVATLQSRIEATYDDLLLNPTDPERFESLVNQYAALSKLVLWWESQNSSTLQHLRSIRVATKTIVKFVDRLSTHTQRKAAKALEEEHALFEHTAISMWYVDQLQRHAGYHSGANQNVYRVFQDTNRDAVEAFADPRGHPIPDPDRLADIIDEYDAIDARITPNQVIQYCKNLMRESE